MGVHKQVFLNTSIWPQVSHVVVLRAYCCIVELAVAVVFVSVKYQ
jgi:hypothetical protein